MPRREDSGDAGAGSSGSSGSYVGHHPSKDRDPLADDPGGLDCGALDGAQFDAGSFDALDGAMSSIDSAMDSGGGGGE